MRTALEIATFPSRTRRETERTQFTPFTRRSLGSVPVPITVLSLSLSLSRRLDKSAWSLQLPAPTTRCLTLKHAIWEKIRFCQSELLIQVNALGESCKPEPVRQEVIRRVR